MKNKIELGDLARDQISGYEGVVIACTMWLYGCRRLTLQSQGMQNGKPIDSYTIDDEQAVLVKTAAVVKDEQRRTAGPSPEPKIHSDPVR